MFEIMNKSFEILGEITEWKSILWHPQYLSETGGDFEIQLPISFNYIEEEFYILKSGSDKFGIVRTIEEINTEGDGLYLKITGDFGESILSYRVISRMNKRGAFNKIVHSILKSNFINPSNSKRKIDNFSFEDDESFSDRVSKQIVGKKVNQAFLSLFGYRGYGYQIGINPERNGFVFSMLRGTDRSVNQMENPHVIFCRENFNLGDFSSIKSNKNYFTHVIVGGEGEGGCRDFVTVPSRSTEYNSGINRREEYVDAGKISSNAGEDEEFDEEYYYDALRTEGYTKLQESYINEACEGVVKDNMYELGTDYFIGDIVTLRDEEIEKEYSIRVLGALYSYDENGVEELSIELGNMNFPDDDIPGEEDETIEEEADETNVESNVSLGVGSYYSSVKIIPINFTSTNISEPGTPIGFLQTLNNENVLMNFSFCIREFSSEKLNSEITIFLSEKEYSIIAELLKKEIDGLKIPIHSETTITFLAVSFVEEIANDDGTYTIKFSSATSSADLSGCVFGSFTRILKQEITSGEDVEIEFSNDLILAGPYFTTQDGTEITSDIFNLTGDEFPVYPYMQSVDDTYSMHVIGSWYKLYEITGTYVSGGKTIHKAEYLKQYSLIDYCDPIWIKENQIVVCTSVNKYSDIHLSTESGIGDEHNTAPYSPIHTTIDDKKYLSECNVENDGWGTYTVSNKVCSGYYEIGSGYLGNDSKIIEIDGKFYNCNHATLIGYDANYDAR